MPRATPSRRRTRLLRVALGTAWLALGCSRNASVQTRTYEPGRQAIKIEGLGVELLEAAYDERQLTVRLAFENVGSTPATIERTGLLLAYEQLEFPALQNTAAQTIEVPAGAREQVIVSFDTGTKVTKDAELVVRGARRGETWLELLRLPVPGAPE